MRWLEPAAGPERAEPDRGPNVVLLHGIPTSPELWRHVLPRLGGCRPRAWEMVGYGDSIPAGRERDLSVARQADYLEAWLDALAIERPILVGHDLGGGVAQIAASRRPDRYRGLVLTNAIAFDSWPVAPMRLLRAGGAAFRHVPAPLWKRVFHRVLASMHRDPRVGWDSARVHWSHYSRHGGGAALVRQAEWLRTEDTIAVQDRLPELDLPARVVWGDADPYQPLAYGARLARALGTAVRAIPGGLHFTPEDHPAALADAITGLAAEVSP